MAHSLRVHSGAGTTAEGGAGICSQEAESGCWSSARCLLFFESGVPGDGKMPLTFRVDLPV